MACKVGTENRTGRILNMHNIENILEQYHRTGAAELFTFWQHEKRLRQEARYSEGDLNNLNLNSAEELDLLYRAWYHSHRKTDFLNVLCINLNRMPIMKWFMAASPEVTQSVLEYLPWYISKMQPPADRLQFLVHIYRQELDPPFNSILHMLDLGQCHYLLDRTANAELRKHLKTRLQVLQDRHQDLYFGWPVSQSVDAGKPGLFGDRNTALHTAIELVWRTMSERGQEPYGLKAFLNMLECADLIFQCGMVEDSLAVLMDIYQDYLEKNRLVDLLQDEQIYRLIQRLLRRVTPVYAVLQSAPRSTQKYHQIYKEYFPHFRPDPAAQAYLQLFDHLLSPDWLPSRGNWAIISTLSDRIHVNRPAETMLLSGDWMSVQPIALLQSLANQKKQSYPQEALTLCLFIRWLHQHGVAAIDTSQAVWLYSMHQEFWNWVPSRLFMNTDIWSVLAPLLNPQVRRDGERLIAILRQMPGDRIPQEIANRPDLFRKKDAVVQRHILSGRFLGVY